MINLMVFLNTVVNNQSPSAFLVSSLPIIAMHGCCELKGHISVKVHISRIIEVFETVKQIV